MIAIVEQLADGVWTTSVYSKVDYVTYKYSTDEPEKFRQATIHGPDGHSVLRDIQSVRVLTDEGVLIDRDETDSRES